MTRSYVAVGSERSGPFSPDELPTAAIALEPGTLVWAQGMSEWSRADGVAELAPLLAEANATGPTSTSVEPPPVPMAATAAQGAVGTDFILLNPRLPRMAQAICVFALVVGASSVADQFRLVPGDLYASRFFPARPGARDRTTLGMMTLRQGGHLCMSSPITHLNSYADWHGKR